MPQFAAEAAPVSDEAFLKNPNEAGEVENLMSSVSLSLVIRCEWGEENKRSEAEHC